MSVVICDLRQSEVQENAWALLHIILRGKCAPHILPLFRDHALAIPALESIIAYASHGRRFPHARFLNLLNRTDILPCDHLALRRLEDLASDLLWELDQPMFG